MYLKGLAALALGGVAAGVGYIGFGDASGHPVKLDAPWVEHGLDWAEDGLDALRTRIGADDGTAGEAAGAALEAAVRDGLAAQAPAAPPPSTEPPKDCATPTGSPPGAALIGDQLGAALLREGGRRCRRRGERRAGLLRAARPLGQLRRRCPRRDLGPAGRPGRRPTGDTLACVEALVAARYAQTFLTEASVSAAFAARPAVIVTGRRARARLLHGDPGMVLRQLLALAGARSMQPDPGAEAAVAPLLARKAELDELAAGLRLEIAGADGRARRTRSDPELTADERGLFQARLGAGRLQSELDNLSARVETFDRTRRTARRRWRRSGRCWRCRSSSRRARPAGGEKRQRLDELRGLTERGLAPPPASRRTRRR